MLKTSLYLILKSRELGMTSRFYTQNTKIFYNMIILFSQQYSYYIGFPSAGLRPGDSVSVQSTTQLN